MRELISLVIAAVMLCGAFLPIVALAVKTARFCRFLDMNKNCFVKIGLSYYVMAWVFCGISVMISCFKLFITAFTGNYPFGIPAASALMFICEYWTVFAGLNVFYASPRTIYISGREIPLYLIDNFTVECSIGCSVRISAQGKNTQVSISANKADEVKQFILNIYLPMKNEMSKHGNPPSDDNGNGNNNT